MVKSGVPLQEIKAAYDADTGGDVMSCDGRTTATMAWALLRYSDTVPGALDEALALRSALLAHRDQLKPSVYAFLTDAFVGDAPIDIALQTFHEHSDHWPHRAAMSRLLTRAWERSANVDEQCALFESYVKRFPGLSAHDFHCVTKTAVRNVVNGVQCPENLLLYLTRLSVVFQEVGCDKFSLVDTMLTEIGRRWTGVDEARSLVLAILANFESTPGYWDIHRRLNSLQYLTGVDELIERLWDSSQEFCSYTLNNKALVRATNGGQLFVEKWFDRGLDDEKVTRSYCVRNGYFQ